MARRVHDPYDVADLTADLTADVSVRAVGSAASDGAARASPVAWLLGTARHAVAGHHEVTARRQPVRVAFDVASGPVAACTPVTVPPMGADRAPADGWKCSGGP